MVECSFTNLVVLGSSPVREHVTASKKQKTWNYYKFHQCIVSYLVNWIYKWEIKGVNVPDKNYSGGQMTSFVTHQHELALHYFVKVTVKSRNNKLLKNNNINNNNDNNII